MIKPELLAPVQDEATLTAAINAGADAVYFGVTGFNMRVAAKNFGVDDLPHVVKRAHAAGVKAYLALNIILYDEELEAMRLVVQAAKDAGVDAVICWDHAVIRAARAIDLPVHLSTQASVANTEAALFYKELGIERVVLARECTLEQVKAIKEKAGVEIEVFVHGAMCVSISGRCFMSQFTSCKSANRGACLQPCRRNYILKDVDGLFELEVGPDHILSPQDLCTLPFLEELMQADVDCFKIEGRNKGPEYTHEVTAAYREMIDLVWEHRDTLRHGETQKLLEETKERLLPNLARVFNRGFSRGFYMGKPLDAWSTTSDNAATEKKVYLGEVTNFYKQAGAAEVHIKAQETLKLGDTLLFQGPTTGHVRQTAESMQIEHQSVTTATQGDSIAIACTERVRTGDKVYLVRDASLVADRHTV